MAITVNIHVEPWDPKKFSEPWISRVHFLGSIVNVSYSKGNFRGNSEEGGTLSVEVENHGGIIATGQKCFNTFKDNIEYFNVLENGNRIKMKAGIKQAFDVYKVNGY